MYLHLLLVSLLALEGTEVLCQFPEDFGTPPPLPETGVLLHRSNLLLVSVFVKKTDNLFSSLSAKHNLLPSGMHVSISSPLWELVNM